MRAARAAPLVLLGETHDNAEHHRLQLRLLAEIAATGRKPALVMEQFDREHQAALDTERARAGRTLDSVLDAGNFNRRGWKAEFYGPLVAFALAHDLPLVAGNLSRAQARAIVRAPATADAPPVDARVEQRLAADIEGSHCGQHIEAALLTGMVAAQRARDVTMARALQAQLERSPRDGAVLIAGIGHVRADRGVPLYLDTKPLVVAFVEVEADRRDPRDYLDGGFSADGSYDYVWFTAKAERDDPCARLGAGSTTGGTAAK